MANLTIQSVSKRGSNLLKFPFLSFVVLGLFAVSSNAVFSVKKAEASVKPEILNTCIVPTAGTKITAYGVPSGGEFPLQQVLTNKGYSINTTVDDTGYQDWTVPADTISIDFVSTYIDNIASNPEAFGYYTNGDISNFVPLWKSAAAHSALVPVLAHGTPFVFSIPTVGVTSVGFAIDSQSGTSHTRFATKSSLNALGEDHAVVFNPSANKYVLGFEDLPFSSSDKDYQDAVVEINVTGCQKLATQCISGENLVKNGGFEFPKVDNSQGWDVFANGTIGLDWAVNWMPSVTGAPVLGNLEIQNNFLGVAKGGVQYAELDSDWNFDISGESASTVISQNIATIPGKTYNLKYSFSARPDTGSADNMMDILWGGALASSTSATGIGFSTNIWKDYSMDVVATTTLTTLSFADKGPANSLGVFLDDVSLVCDTCVTKSGFIVSDTDTSVTGETLVPATILSPIHTAWTADVDGASTSAKWIWSSNPVDQGDTTVNATRTFTRTFSVIGTPTSGQLTLAADNFYKVWVNGILVGQDAAEDNYSIVGQDVYTISNLVAGTNTLKIEVTNLAVDGSTPESNPAGLLYSLVWSAKDCSNGDGGTGNEGTSVIHVQKFIDGELATTGTFNVDATLSWGAPNAGNFVGGLTPLDSENSYTTQTVALTDSINTAILTELVEGTTNVIPFDGKCKVGSYQLVGYSIGSSFAAAQAASTTPGHSLVLSNNFSTDQYVIVHNKTCPDDNGGGSGPDLSTVTMCKFDKVNNNTPLSNWTLTLLGSKLQTVVVNPDGTNYSSTPVSAGTYVLIGNGSYKYRNDANASTSDTAFSYRLASDSVYGGAYAPWVRVFDFPGSIKGYLGVMVNGVPADWGSVFNPSHVYTHATTTGVAGPFVFSILDDQYADNSGSLSVDIYKSFSGVTKVDGCVVFDNVPYGTYTADEILQDGWVKESGTGPVTVDGPIETFNIYNQRSGENPPSDGNPGDGGTECTTDCEGGGIGGDPGEGARSSSGGSRGGRVLASSGAPAVLGASSIGAPEGQVLGASIGLPNTGTGPIDTSNPNAPYAFLVLLIGVALLGTTNYAFLQKQKSN
jgi:hypothetical protein